MTESRSTESPRTHGPDGADREDADRREPPNDVDPGADSQPDPAGYGPLSDGKDGQQFG